MLDARLRGNVCPQLWILFLGAVKPPLMLSEQTSRGGIMNIMFSVVSRWRAPWKPGVGQQAGRRFHVQHDGDEKSVLPQRSSPVTL